MPIDKIVVVEDDMLVRKNLEQQLRQRRYDVAAVSNIAAAREVLAKDTFDLVFADVRLPDGEGTDLLRELQARPQKPLVVIMTGFGTADFAVSCLREGAFDYLIKPFSNEQLEFTLKKAENFTHLVRVNTYLSHDEGDESSYELLYCCGLVARRFKWGDEFEFLHNSMNYTISECSGKSPRIPERYLSTRIVIRPASWRSRPIPSCAWGRE